MTARSISLPSGRSQSNGTDTVAQSRPSPGGSHGDQAIAVVAPPANGAAAADGTVTPTAARLSSATATVPTCRPDVRAALRLITALPSTDPYDGRPSGGWTHRYQQGPTWVGARAD